MTFLRPTVRLIGRSSFLLITILFVNYSLIARQAPPASPDRFFGKLRKRFFNEKDLTGTMALKKTVRRVAVLGAGVMGSQIAAHFANANIPVLLLDVALPDEQQRSAAALRGIEWAASRRPGA